jgi:hypothetical protein
MLNKMSLSTLALASLLLTACNDSDEPAQPEQAEQAKFSLGVSDAPVEEAEVVAIEIDSITLKNTVNSEEILIDTFTDDTGESIESIQVDLLDFTGMAQMKIIDETQGITLDDGVYTMGLAIVDAGSYVILNNDANEYDIKVPSSRLKLGEFTVSSEATQVGDKPAYTIEFDLMKSLVQRGNDPAKNGFIIKPHGVRIVSLSGGIAGTVSPENTNLGACMVYLYDGAPTESQNLADLFDSNDDSFDSNDDLFEDKVSNAMAPLAVTIVDGAVDVDGNISYSIGFVPEGDYTVALRCDALDDDNIQYERLIIPSIDGNSKAVNVNAGVTTDVNF